MKDETSIFYVGDSVMVRIPAGMARFFELKDSRDTKKCMIEDTGKKTAILTFE